jgi:glyoxylate reductase
MSKRKPLVVVTRKLPDVVETRMMELFNTRLNATDEPMGKAELVEAVKTAEVLVPTVTDRIDKAVLMQAGDQLKLIANFGNGVDNIDVETALSRGITVTNTPGVLTDDTADFTMALIMAVSRRIIEGAKVIGADNSWAGWSPTWMLGHRIGGKRLGIIGMGRIGTAVARRAKAFGLQIHYHNRKPVHPRVEEELEATYWESLDQMLARMDIVSVNCPHTPATYHLLSARRLKLMKKEAIIVNTARGEVIDENALARMLEAGELGGAGLDVFEHEPAVNPRLLKAKKAVLLPHMGSATIEGRIDMGEKVIINIKTWVDGHNPPDRVLPSCCDVHEWRHPGEGRGPASGVHHAATKLDPGLRRDDGNQKLGNRPHRLPARLGIIAHCVSERREQLHRIRIPQRLELRVPLRADGEALGVAHRDRLDDAVGGCRFHGEAFRQPLDALAVDRVHHGLALAEDLLENAARADVDGVGWRIAHIHVVMLGRPVVEAALDVLQFRLERAAHHHVQLLEAAADAEQGHAPLQHLVDQLQRGGVAVVVIGLMRLGRLLAIMRRMHVGHRAGDDDAVEMIEQRVDFQRVDHRRDHDGRAQRHLGHGAHIFVADRVKQEAVILIGVRRQSDEGQVGHFRTL